MQAGGCLLTEAGAGQGQRPAVTGGGGRGCEAILMRSSLLLYHRVQPSITMTGVNSLLKITLIIIFILVLN